MSEIKPKAPGPASAEDLAPNPDQPFRLLDLPLEIQRHVFRKYFEGAQMRIYQKTPTMLMSDGVPSLKAELVSHHVRDVSRSMREECISREILVDTGPSFLDRYLASFCMTTENQWIREHCNSFRFEGHPKPMLPPQWKVLLDHCPRLRPVDISAVGKPLLDEHLLHEYLPLNNEKRKALAIAVAEGKLDFGTEAFIEEFKLRDLARLLQDKHGKNYKIKFHCALFTAIYVRPVTMMLAEYNKRYLYIEVS